MYLSSTDPKTRFTKDAAIQTIILSSSYVGAMLFSGTKLIQPIHASPVNPAIALAIVVWNPSKKNWATSYIFLGSSFAGSFLAIIFFRFIYQKTAETIEVEELGETGDKGMEL